MDSLNADDVDVGPGVASDPDSACLPIPPQLYCELPLQPPPGVKTDVLPGAEMDALPCQADSLRHASDTAPPASPSQSSRSSSSPSSSYSSSGTLDYRDREHPFSRRGPVLSANAPGRRAGAPASWEKLLDQRSRIRGLFDDLRRKRSRLQDLQLQKDQADRELYLAVRRQLFKTDPTALDRFVAASERATLVYQDTEAKLHQILEDLDDAELDVEILENRVYYNHVRRRSSLPPTEDEEDEDEDDDPDDDYRPPSRMSLCGISRDRPEDLHPLYQRMRDAFGDLQLSKEYLLNLTLKHSALESKDRAQLPQDTLNFLDSFDSTTRNAKAEIDRWTDEFEQLRSTCRDRRLIPQTSPFYEYDNSAITIFGEDISLDEEEDWDDASLAHPTYHTLLSNPKHLLQYPLPLTSKEALRRAISQPISVPSRERQIAEAMQEHGIGMLLHDARDGDKNDLVNRWLLQKLRLSPLEVRVLHSSCSQHLRILDVDRWQQDVLRFWPRDGAVTHTRASSGPHDNPLMYVPSNKRTEPRSETISHAVSAPAGV